MGVNMDNNIDFFFWFMIDMDENNVFILLFKFEGKFLKEKRKSKYKGCDYYFMELHAIDLDTLRWYRFRGLCKDKVHFVNLCAMYIRLLSESLDCGLRLLYDNSSFLLLTRLFLDHIVIEVHITHDVDVLKVVHELDVGPNVDFVNNKEDHSGDVEGRTKFGGNSRGVGKEVQREVNKGEFGINGFGEGIVD